jgi:predicted nucleic acid-binding protein
VAVILDTNALSAFADGDEKLLRTIENEAELAVPVIVLGEYLYGIQQSRQRASYEAWIKTNLPLFDLLPVVRETAERYAEIRHELQAAGTRFPATTFGLPLSPGNIGCGWSRGTATFVLSGVFVPSAGSPASPNEPRTPGGTPDVTIKTYRFAYFQRSHELTCGQIERIHV